MAGNAPRKKFANSNLNAVLGAPKAAPTNLGPAVRSAAVVKPVAKPKGLISLGKAPPAANIQARKGAAWSQLQEEAESRRAEVEAKKDDLAKPEWAVIDFEDIDKPLRTNDIPEEEGCPDEEFDPGDKVDPDEPGEEEVDEDGPSQQAAEAERQFTKSHRSYLAMECVPGTSPDGVSEEQNAAASDTLGQEAVKRETRADDDADCKVAAAVMPRGGSGRWGFAASRDSASPKAWADQELSQEDEDDEDWAADLGAEPPGGGLRGYAE
eukprot:CAMPEP_0180602110 /NCGR_PEP_ID=MMETSP1037_2-20121125/24804_1 /TAXON_ID=632150 /ORGANISM="Azadinium spinosum, Strain 3D9" /LENGTH=266 /DNA_ID=CAMNT_0022620925 /DNA_START=176 /DNA_END=973 /DNA_ORIENTATION=-